MLFKTQIQMSPRDLSWLAITQTPVKDHQQTLVWKSHKKHNNNNNNNNNNKTEKQLENRNGKKQQPYGCFKLQTGELS